MSTPLPLARLNNLPTISSEFIVVEIGHAGTRADLVAAIETEIATEFAAAGETPPPKGMIKSVLISNDHATEAVYLSSRFMSSAATRGIKLDAGDAIFLAFGESQPSSTNSIQYGAGGTCTLSVACFY
jgi:hypothetical protein